MNKIREAKIEVLKRQCRRKNLIKKLIANHIDVREDSFLDIDANEIFCSSAYKKICTADNAININVESDLYGEDWQTNKALSKKYLINVLRSIANKQIFVRVMFSTGQEIEAIRFLLYDVIVQFDRILEVLGFLGKNGGDFELVGEKLEFAICICAVEYFQEYIEWGELPKLDPATQAY